MKSSVEVLSFGLPENKLLTLGNSAITLVCVNNRPNNRWSVAATMYGTVHMTHEEAVSYPSDAC